MKTETEKCIEPPKTRIGEEGFSPEAFGGSTTLPTPRLQLRPPELREKKLLLF